MENYLKRKISDSKLREFAEEKENNECRSVIVELDVPARTSSLIKSKNNTRGNPELFSLNTNPAFDEEDDSEKDSLLMNELEKKLSALNLSEEPIRLEHAQAFVVSVTPNQLRALSEMSLAGFIRPNRIHISGF